MNRWMTINHMPCFDPHLAMPQTSGAMDPQNWWFFSLTIPFFGVMLIMCEAQLCHPVSIHRQPGQ